LLVDSRCINFIIRRCVAKYVSTSSWFWLVLGHADGVMVLISLGSGIMSVHTNRFLCVIQLTVKLALGSDNQGKCSICSSDVKPFVFSSKYCYITQWPIIRIAQSALQTCSTEQHRDFSGNTLRIKDTPPIPIVKSHSESPA